MTNHIIATPEDEDFYTMCVIEYMTVADLAGIQNDEGFEAHAFEETQKIARKLWELEVKRLHDRQDKR